MMFSASETSNRTILIVDDKEPILQILGIGLRDNGYEVLTAKSAKDALDIVHKKEFRYALLDIRLPDMNGIELGVEIKKYNPGVFIILMTGYPGIKSAIKALRHHAYDYLIKPFRVEQVISAIERSRREIQLIGESSYNSEIIRALREENKQLKAMLKELMPDETMLRAKSFDKYRALRSERELALRSYAQQNVDNVPKRKKQED